MFLAAKEAVGDLLLQLPCATDAFLHLQRVSKSAYLLEFVNADYQVFPCLLGYLFGQL